MRGWVWISVLIAAPALAGPRRAPPEPAEDLRAKASAQNMRRIGMLEEFIDESEGDRKAEMMFRLAELYRDEARGRLADSMEAHNEACNIDVDACSSPVDLAAAHRVHDRALRLYEAVVRQHPTYQRADEARFALAIGLLEREMNAQAGDQLRAYVRLHPDGVHAHLAWLQLGELAFDAGRAGVAVRAFRQASAFEDGEQRLQAMHRLAWALKNVGEDHEAVDVLKAVVAQLGTGEADRELGVAAKRDLVRFAVEIGALTEVESLLGHGEDRRRALVHAATRHAEQGQVDAAIQVWRRVISESPDHPERPAALVAITTQLRGVGRYTEAARTALRLEAEHRAGGAWARSNATDPGVVERARDAADRVLREVALSAHSEARKVRRQPLRAEAAAAAQTAYDTWLAAFSGREPAPDVNFALAELHYENKHWPEAFEHYSRAWNAASNPTRAQEAVSGGLHAAEAWLKASPAPGPRPDTDLATVAPRELTPAERAFIEAADAAAIRRLPDQSAITYRVAYVLYEAFHFESAAERFKRVIAQEPQSADAERAAHLVADMLAIRESWAALAQNASFYAEQPDLGTPAFRLEMQGLARRALLKAIEADVQRSGDRRAAAEATMGWVQTHGEVAEPSVLSVALRDAAAHYESVGDPAAAAQVRRAFLRHPRLDLDAHRQGQWLALGDDEERLAQWRTAALAYGSAVALGGQEPRLVEAAWRAAALFEALEDPEAATAWTAFVELADPSEPRWYDGRVRQARASGRADGWRALLRDDQAPLPVRLTAALELGDPQSRRMALGLVPEPVGADSVDLVGALKFSAMEQLFQEFSEARLAGRTGLSPAGERRHFAQRLGSLQGQARRLQEGYAAVTATGSGEWGLAAAVRLAAIQEHWSRILLDSDDPTHLTPSQLRMYRQELADRAWARRDVAAAAYAMALGRAFEVQLYTPATAEARARLGELEPQDWPALHEVVPRGPWRSVRVHDADLERL